MIIIDTLAPILLLLGLGAALARWKFLGPQFMADLNKLAFYVALPALIFRSVATAGAPGEQTSALLATLIATTLIVFFGCWVVAKALGIAPASQGSFVQLGYRGNLVYIGIPVLAYAFAGISPELRSQYLATALLAMAPTMALFNVLAVIALQSGRPTTSRFSSMRLTLLTIAKNPLILACAAGLVYSASTLPLPTFLERSLEALGSAAVPVALLCIGGSLASMSLAGNHRLITIAALIKVGISPLIAFSVGRLLGLHPPEVKISLVLAACPTAAAAFIMARQMQGDIALTSGGIALTTILSGFSLALILWLTSSGLV